MIKNLAILNVGDPLNHRGQRLCRARSVTVRLNAVVGRKTAAMTRQSDKYDISSLGKALKKFIAWLRDLFNNE